MLRLVFTLFVYFITNKKIYQHSKLTKNALLFKERGFCFDLKLFIVVDNLRIGKIEPAAIHKMITELCFELACHLA